MKYGIKEFNEKCRESVFEYESLWREMSKRMGYMIDLDNIDQSQFSYGLVQAMCGKAAFAYIKKAA